MLGEDREPAKDEDSPMAEEKLPIIAKMTISPRLQD